MNALEAHKGTDRVENKAESSHIHTLDIMAQNPHKSADLHSHSTAKQHLPNLEIKQDDACVWKPTKNNIQSIKGQLDMYSHGCKPTDIGKVKGQKH